MIRHLQLVIVLVVFGMSALAAGSAPVTAQTRPLPPLPIDDTDELLEEEARPEPKPALSDAPVAVNPVSIDETDIDPPAVETPDRSSTCDHTFPGEAPADLAGKIDALLKAKELAGARIGIFAVGYPEGRVLYQHNANELLNPASVTKLVTAAVALDQFGPAHRFRTEIYAGEGGCPPLYLKGGGDPGLDTAALRELATLVKEDGIKCVSALHYDVSIFDDRILAPHFEEKVSDAHWRPKIGAVGMADGALGIRVMPGDYAGAAPRVKISPDCNCILVDSRALTVEQPGDKGVAVSVAGKGDEVLVQVTGEVPMTWKKGRLFRRAIPHPDLFTTAHFRDILTNRGISVRSSDYRPATVPEDARLVGGINSSTVKSDVVRMQRWSKNFVAEQFVKLMGQGHCSPMTFGCGLKRMRKVLTRLHLEARCLRLENGSGLFDANRFSAAQMVRLLVEVANRKDIGTIYKEALPLGKKTGTLKERMLRVKGKVRAKTGTLDNISTLAGYVDRRRGGYIAFAIFFNDAQTSAYTMRSIQDRIVERLAAWKPGKKKK